MPSPSDDSAILQVALRAGRLAATICRRVQAESALAAVSGVPESKAGDEPVTVADYASQAVILRELRLAFPHHGVLAEEDAAHLRQQPEPVQQRVLELVGDALGETLPFEQLCEWIDHPGHGDAPLRWAIDPIDGTKGFIRHDQYAVALGLLDQGRPRAGVLVCPNLPVRADRPDGARGVVFAAAAGRGATAQPLDGGDAQPIRVSDRAEPERLRVLGSVVASHGDPELTRGLVAELGLAGGVVKMDSQVKYGALARGEADVYLRPRSRSGWRDRVWDHVAGVVVATEAGGRATDTLGAPLDFTCGATLENNRGVLVTNGPLHDTIVACLRRLQAADPGGD